MNTGGSVILATFAPDGPLRCSGLETMRYDANSIDEVFGKDFTVISAHPEEHQTPAGKTQRFMYFHLQRPSL